MEREALKAGDLIDILATRMTVPDCWVPADPMAATGCWMRAVVVTVENHCVNAMLMAGADTSRYIALEPATENRTWRRT